MCSNILKSSIIQYQFEKSEFNLFKKGGEWYQYELDIKHVYFDIKYPMKFKFDIFIKLNFFDIFF